MKFIRFQSMQPCFGTRSKLGIFQIAFRVRNSMETSVHIADEINQQIRWLQTHLHSPNLSHQDYRAVFWFKDTAHAPMKRIWAIKPHLEAHGYWIDVVKTLSPGQVVYEDGWQVAAKPWRNRK